MMFDYSPQPVVMGGIIVFPDAVFPAKPLQTVKETITVGGTVTANVSLEGTLNQPEDPCSPGNF